jgi:hypothetical protein
VLVTAGGAFALAPMFLNPQAGINGMTLLGVIFMFIGWRDASKGRAQNNV